MNALSALNHRIGGVIPALPASRPRWALTPEAFDRLPKPLGEGAQTMFSKFQSTLLSALLLISICVSLATAETPRNGAQETIAIRVSEGTDLGFDLSPDGRSIVFDLL